MSVSPSILLTGRLPDGVSAHVAVQRGDQWISVPTLDAAGVIHGLRWLPLDSSATQACFVVLAGHGVKETPGTLPLGRYLDILADPQAIGLLVDRTEPGSPVEGGGQRNYSALGLRADLYLYQQLGADFLCAMANRDVGALLADQMGLGKTVQAIALLLAMRSEGPSLVVAPASLLTNWVRELRQFAPTLTCLSHSGSSRTGVHSGLLGYDVVLTSYETLNNDMSFMGGLEWNVVVLDEAQTIRNPDTTRSKAVKSLRRRVSVAVTGTPVENRLLDLWSLGEFVIPALLGTRSDFENAFPDQLDEAQALGHLMAPITLRRLVADVAQDLPELIQSETSFSLPWAVAEHYRNLEARTPGPLAVSTALRVLCAHATPDAWLGNDLPPKVDHTLRLIESAFEERQKVLVFASFQEALDRLFDAVLKRHNDAFLAVIDGRLGVAERQTLIDDFSDFEGPGALFMNPRAAGVGLNIAAANHVIHFNPEWNPAVTSQATARAYRRKQTLPVSVHHLFYEGTVEEEAMARSEWKMALANRVDEGAKGDG